MIQSRELFHLQTELIDSKVDMAVGKAIDRVIDKINDLKQDMHTQVNELRQEMQAGFMALDKRIVDLDKRVVDLDKRVVAVETRLGIIGKKQQGFYDRTLDYLFKTGWGVITLAFAYLIAQFHLLITH